MLDGRGAIPISIHSLRVEGDRVPPCSLISVIIFQSTPSVWRETGPSKSIDLPEAISIHSLRVEGDHGAAMRAVILHAISIHSLRVEGDTDLLAMLKVDLDFNPLPPCGGRPITFCVDGGITIISIHSLRVEGDSSAPCFCTMRTISIHSLRVEGDLVNSISPINSCHISIHSLRVEGDPPDFASLFSGSISIHSLRVEGDQRIMTGCQSCCHFNPLPPCGGRPAAFRP